MKKQFLYLLAACMSALSVYAQEQVTLSVHAQSWLSDVEEQSVRISNVKFTFNVGTGTSKPAYYESDGLRIYKNNTITIESLSDQPITEIVFTYTIKSNGSLQVISGGGAYDNNTQTWTGSAEAVAFQQVSSTGMSGPQVRITYIQVVTGSGDGGETSELKDVFLFPATYNDGVVSGSSPLGFTFELQNSSANTPTAELIILSGQQVVFHAPTFYIITGLIIESDEADAGPNAVRCTPEAISTVFDDGFHSNDSMTWLDGSTWNYTFDGASTIVFDALPSNVSMDELHWRKITVLYDYASIVSINRDQLRFPDVMINNTQQQTVTLMNKTDAGITLNSINGLKTPFSITDAPSLPFAIPAGESLTLTIQYQPTSTGQHAATLALSTSAGDFEVSLSGNALSQMPYPMSVMSK